MGSGLSVSQLLVSVSCEVKRTLGLVQSARAELIQGLRDEFARHCGNSGVLLACCRISSTVWGCDLNVQFISSLYENELKHCPLGLTCFLRRTVYEAR